MLSRVEIDGAITRYLDAARGIRPPEDAELFADYYTSQREQQRGVRDAIIRNIEFALRRFPPSTPVLDVGTGFGLQAYVFRCAGHPVVGVDLKDRRIRIAAQLAADLGVDQVRYEAGDAVDEMEPDTFGGVWIHRTIHHIDPLPPFLERVRTSLLDEGHVVVCTQSGRTRVSDFREVAVASGFEVATIERGGYLTALPPRLRPPGTGRLDRFLSRVPGVRALGGSANYDLVRRTVS